LKEGLSSGREDTYREFCLHVSAGMFTSDAWMGNKYQISFLTSSFLFLSVAWCPPPPPPTKSQGVASAALALGRNVPAPPAPSTTRRSTTKLCTRMYLQMCKLMLHANRQVDKIATPCPETFGPNHAANKMLAT
jgi:hypothetical protein